MKGLTSYPNPRLRGWNLPRGVQRSGVYYWLVRRVIQVVIGGYWRMRVFERRNEPAEGSAVYICNHQSFLDPMLMSLALRRPMNYMARDSLFRFFPFRLLIESVNAFPVRRRTADLTAMKEAMRRLRAGGQVVIFAEGTRTKDGRIGPLLPGVVVLAQRAADWTVPVVIEGAFEAWPRTNMLPGTGSIVVRYGEPIPQAKARMLSPQELMDQVRCSLISMQTDLRSRLGKPPLRYE